MKALKTITMGLAALALSTLASAQTITLHITGSTAYRAAVHKAIQDILVGGGTTVGYTGATLSSASQAVFVGTTITGGYSVAIKTSWSGSVGGVQTVAQLNPTVTVNTWLQNGLNGPNQSTASSSDQATAADVTMSDSFQSSTQFFGSGYATLTDNTVGVVPFVWAKGETNDTTVSASAANVINMTPLLARALLSSGAIPLSMLTGNTSDATINVDVVGRDEDSGTRLDTFAESGFGIFNQPIQFEPLNGGSPITAAGGSITSLILYPADTVDGFSYPQGQAGFSSGGTLATNLNTAVASGSLDYYGQKFLLLGYLGLSDEANVNGGHNALTWNGVAYTPAAVQQGQYTFWSYEHLDYRSTLSQSQQTIALQIANQILTADATASGVLVGSMNVSRTVEGGVVTHN